MINRIRRPFPVSRRDTDSVQLNTLEPQKTADNIDSKGAEVGVEADSYDIEHGHLQEIEVDVDKVLHDGEIKDVDADTSPYPEGMIDLYLIRKGMLLILYVSPCRGS
jgi:hypothetical protein